MSIIEPVDHTPVEPTPRKRLTRAERDTLLARQDNICGDPACDTSLIWAHASERGPTIYAPMIDEHILPLDLGGSNDLSNRALYCVPCARAKTREDMARIYKAARIRRTLAGEKKPGRRISSRGFARDPLRGER